jgi:hypothetical protein
LKEKTKEGIRKISHPALGEIYFLNEMETRITLDEILVDKLYFQGRHWLYLGQKIIQALCATMCWCSTAVRSGSKHPAYCREKAE